jgi:type IV secretory pathway VirB10-like protein
MAQGLDERLDRGLYVALGCLLTLSALAAAAVETPRFDKATPTASVAADQSPGAKPDSSQADTGQPATIPPVKADAPEEPSQQPSGPSAEAQESYRAQMRELQEQLEEVNVRAKTAKSGLIAIKSDMASQGLSLRSDVLEAEARMNHLIGKAQREISSSDAVSAEQDLQMAGYSIDFIERFLGR